MNNEDMTKYLKKQSKAELIELLTRIHKASGEDIKEMIEAEKIVSANFFSPGETVELLVICPLNTALKCKVLKTGELVTFRKNRFEIPGETITVEVSKHWKHGNTAHISGERIKKEFIISNLNIQALSVQKYDSISRSDFMLDSEHPEEIRNIYKSLFTEKEYDQYEMETVTPGLDYAVSEYDPIYESVEMKHAGDIEGSQDLLFKTLEKDFRCIEAYAHLGDSYLPDDEESSFVDFAIGYYKAGIQLGEYFLGKDFDGQLPWGMIDNRPFLRSLHGYGICLMRSGKKEEAVNVFKRILQYSPMDNLGVRFLISELIEL